ncbi:MAG: HIT family protein [Stackebrandtia sp.]
MNSTTGKIAFDVDAYVERTVEGPCFICRMLGGEPEAAHEIIWEDDDHVAFLNRYPTLLGYTLVAPKRHVEDTIGEYTADEYLRMQAAVHRVAVAIRATLPVERTYVMSLGSRQGNSHVHWHVAPLPPGVPHERQQFHALMVENGVLDQSDEDKAALARRLRAALA